METDWLFEKPIDQEHKEYKLLSYFQKMGEKLDNMELYPGFIELSLHLASIQTLIKDKKLIYTDKKFDTIDDELLVREAELLGNDLPLHIAVISDLNRLIVIQPHLIIPFTSRILVDLTLGKRLDLSSDRSKSELLCFVCHFCVLNTAVSVLVSLARKTKFVSVRVKSVGIA